MVLNQNPGLGTRRHQLTGVAESLMKKAGMRVIPAGDYYQEHEGADWRVSKWEGHPSKEAHEVFAQQFAAYIRELTEAEPYLIN